MTCTDAVYLINVGGKLLYWVTSIAWPLASLILAFMFRDVIRLLGSVVDHLARKAKKGMGFEFAPDQRPDDIKVEPTLPSLNDNSLKELEKEDPSLVTYVTNLRDVLRQHNIVVTTETEQTLLGAWAIAVRARDFDRMGRHITQSQLDALRKVGSTSQDGRGLRRLFEAHNARLKQGEIEVSETYDIASWMNFLVQNELVHRNGNNYSITELGKAFLRYVAESGLPDILPY